MPSRDIVSSKCVDWCQRHNARSYLIDLLIAPLVIYPQWMRGWKGRRIDSPSTRLERIQNRHIERLLEDFGQQSQHSLTHWIDRLLLGVARPTINLSAIYSLAQDYNKFCLFEWCTVRFLLLYIYIIIHPCTRRVDGWFIRQFLASGQSRTHCSTFIQCSESSLNIVHLKMKRKRKTKKIGREDDFSRR